MLENEQNFNELLEAVPQKALALLAISCACLRHQYVKFPFNPLKLNVT